MMLLFADARFWWIVSKERKSKKPSKTSTSLAPVSTVVTSFGVLLPLKNEFRSSYPAALFWNPIAKYFLPLSSYTTSLQNRSATRMAILLWYKYRRSVKEINECSLIIVIHGSVSFFTCSTWVKAGRWRKRLALMVLRNSPTVQSLYRMAKYIRLPPFPKPWSYHRFSRRFTLKEGVFSCLYGERYQ